MSRSAFIPVVSACVLVLCVLAAGSGCSSKVVGQLPPGSEYVGGGMTILWTAPTAGTAYVYEWTTKKIVTTQSLEEGEEFTFEVGSADKQQVEEYFGVDFDELRPVLYFRARE